MPVLWALRGEVAFRLGDHVAACRYWCAVADRDDADADLREDARYNLVCIDYARGNYLAAYQRYFELAGGEDLDSLDAEEAYTLAALAYLSGFIDDARRYIERTDAERRARFEEVVGAIGTAEA